MGSIVSTKSSTIGANHRQRSGSAAKMLVYRSDESCPFRRESPARAPPARDRQVCALYIVRSLRVAARWTPRVSPSLCSHARKRPAHASHALEAVDAKPGIGRREALQAAMRALALTLSRESPTALEFAKSPGGT